MKKWIGLVLIVLLGVCGESYAVEVSEPFFYGDTGAEMIQTATAVPGGGVLLAGGTYVSGEGATGTAYPWALCTDGDLAPVWTFDAEMIGTPGVFREAVTLDSGKFALVWVENQKVSNPCHVCILSSEGEGEALYALDGVALDIAAYEGGMLVSQYKWGGVNHTLRIPFLQQIEEDGSVVWTQFFDAIPYGEIYTLEPTADGGMMLAGRVRDAEGGADRGFAARLDGESLSWLYVLPEDMRIDSVSDCVALEDGGAVITARTSVMRVDSEGQLMWQTELSGPMQRHVMQISCWQDGYLVANNAKGVPSETNASGESIQLAYLDAQGRPLYSFHTEEIQNTGMTVRFVEEEAGRAFLYGSGRIKGGLNCFMMEVRQ